MMVTTSYMTLLHTVIPLLFSSIALADILPSNNTLATSTLKVVFSITGSTTNGGFVNLAPLTTAIDSTQSSVSITGALKPVDFSNLNTTDSTSIALLSCDPNTNASNIDPTTELSFFTSASDKPQAIILYSLTAPHCTLTGTNGYNNILTVTSASDALMLKNYIALNAASVTTGTIMSTQPSSTSSAAAAASTTPPPSGPTTAVAMSILYSITGIITVLFLVIVTIGALRAHRNPERYGPRALIAGRPRQSRARGIARAMLETIPIVKFGDAEPVKAETPDIEMEGDIHSTPVAVVDPVVHDSPTDKQKALAEESKTATAPTELEAESGLGPADKRNSVADSKDATDEAEPLGCSICTEDFVKGEDVRVLPCHHKYHPACVDPWLLNVSGTCPLCRVDLNPLTSPDAAVLAPEAVHADEGLPPALNADGEVIADNTTIDPAALQQLPRHERIVALRRALAARTRALDREAEAQGSAQGQDEQGRRSRLLSSIRGMSEQAAHWR